MSEETNGPKNHNLRILEFDKKSKHEKERTEANQVVADMFTKLANRALKGDIEDFIITFKSESRGIESMIGGTVRGFDFIGYLGMLEVLKQRLLNIMSQMTYAYSFEKEQPEEETDGKPTDPEKTED